MSTCNSESRCDDCERNDVWVHVLPSFEMFRSFHESAVQTPSSEAPPDYDTSTQVTPVTTGPTSPTPTDYFSHADSISATPSHILSNLNTTSPFLTPASSHTSTPVQHIDPVQVHKLPIVPTSPLLTVDIHVTKSEPPLDTKPQLETILKEHTTSDVIHGYVVLHNNTPRPIAFTMLYVTLEGSVSIHDTRTEKLHTHRFLHMMDLHACYSTACVSSPLSTPCHFGHMDSEGCHIGLTQDRILQPRMKYRKEFIFKLPTTLLDTTCRHGIHHALPPSVGVNRVYKNMKYAACRVDEALGYGHLGVRGSPVVVNDGASRVSVDYNVNATLVGSHPKLKDEFGVPMAAILKDEDYALRIVPSGERMVEDLGQGEVEALKGSVRSSIRNAERMILLCAEGGQKDAVAKLDKEIKEQQLQWHKERLKSEKNKKDLSMMDHLPDFSASMRYVPQAKKKSLFGKKEPTSTSSGIITATVHAPIGNLPYKCPDVMRKVNTPSTLTTNHITVAMDLSFTPSDLAKIQSTTPPDISTTSAKLHMTTIASATPIPITITDDLNLDEIQSQFQGLNTQIEGLKSTFDIQNIPEFEKYVPISLQVDTKCLANLFPESSIMDVLIAKITSDSNWMRQEDSSWTKSVRLDISVKGSINETLIPQFQTCLATRSYAASVELKFKGSENGVVVEVPVRLYK